MAFTTWSAVVTQIKDDIANGVYSRKVIEMGGQKVEYWNFKTALSMLEYAEQRANEELSVSQRPFPRTHLITTRPGTR